MGMVFQMFVKRMGYKVIGSFYKKDAEKDQLRKKCVIEEIKFAEEELTQKYENVSKMK